jgi:hypothetical protein
MQQPVVMFFPIMELRSGSRQDLKNFLRHFRWRKHFILNCACYWDFSLGGK